MKIPFRYRFSLPASDLDEPPPPPRRRAGGRGGRPRVFGEPVPREHVVAVDIEIAQPRDVAPDPLFVVAPHAIMRGARTHHDVTSTLTWGDRIWMAVKGPSDLSRRAGTSAGMPALIDWTLRDQFLGPVLAGEDQWYRAGSELRHEILIPGMVDAKDPVAWMTTTVTEAVRRGERDLAVFPDGRLYQADVMPVYEIKVGMGTYVSISPSAIKRVPKGHYFSPDRSQEAEGFFRKHGGEGEFPVIVHRDAVSVPRAAARWMLKEAVLAMLGQLRQGVRDDEAFRRWLARAGGPSLGSAIGALEAAIEDASLERLVPACGEATDRLRRLHIVDEDPLHATLERLETNLASARRILGGDAVAPSAFR